MENQWKVRRNERDLACGCGLNETTRNKKVIQSKTAHFNFVPCLFECNSSSFFCISLRIIFCFSLLDVHLFCWRFFFFLFSLRQRPLTKYCHDLLLIVAHIAYYWIPFNDRFIYFFQNHSFGLPNKNEPKENGQNIDNNARDVRLTLIFTLIFYSICDHIHA